MKAKFTVNIRASSDTTPNPPKIYDGWRVLHKVEGGWPNTPLGMPEVMPPKNALSVDMTENIQRMSYDLMTSVNSFITPKLWSAVHDGDRAFTNFQGFDMPGDPRRNYILNTNMTSELPKYDKAQRVCGGSFIRGEAVGDVLICKSGVHGIDPDKTMPDTKTIMDNHWFIYAVSMDRLDSISHFPQGQGGPVLIPFIFRGVIEFPLIHFERWQADTLPDPLRIYA